MSITLDSFFKFSPLYLIGHRVQLIQSHKYPFGMHFISVNTILVQVLIFCQLSSWRCLPNLSLRAYLIHSPHHCDLSQSTIWPRHSASKSSLMIHSLQVRSQLHCSACKGPACLFSFSRSHFLTYSNYARHLESPKHAILCLTQYTISHSVPSIHKSLFLLSTLWMSIVLEDSAQMP